MKQKALLILLAIVLFLQLPFFHPEKNYTEEPPNHDIALTYEVPMDVLMILYNSCYDCHSNYTEEYPWYYHIQPISWWMKHHIKEGKEAVNFSEFTQLPPEKAHRKLDKIQEVMEEQSMPLKSYTIMHKSAQLSESEYQSVIDWAIGLKSELKK